MAYELIVPVGTSMLTGWMRGIQPDLQLPAGWVGSHTAASAVVHAPRADKWTPLLKQRLLDGRQRTCAEIDSLRFWLKRRPDVQVARITLIVSDTEPAAWVASMLAALLPELLRTGVVIDPKPVARLSAEKMRAGLVEFIRVSARAIKNARRRGNEAAVNATPGFKAEAALLTLLGGLLGAQVFYLHEAMADMIVVPAVP